MSALNSYAIAGAVAAVMCYVPLTVQVWRKEVIQNFATYFLWALLDGIAAGSIIHKHGNFMLPLVYVTTCSGVLLGILRTGTFAWGRKENITAILVAVCIGVWIMIGDRAATVASTVAVVFAGMPQLIEFWQTPQKKTGLLLCIYSGFFVANGLSIFGGETWSIEDRLYPAVNTAFTIFFVLAVARWRLPQYQAQRI